MDLWANRGAASMDPDLARHNVATKPTEQKSPGPERTGTVGITLSDVERQMRVGALRDLRVTCDCGQQLVGNEWEFLPGGAHGWALHVKGWCIRGCGVIRVMFLSEEKPTPEVAKERLQAEVAKVLEQMAKEAA